VKRLVRYVLGRRKAAVRPGPPGRPRLLIFDFDGTIADTFDAGITILNKLAGEFGYRQLEAGDIPRARDMKPIELMRFLGIRATRMSRLARRGSEELSTLIQGVQPLAGMPEALRDLKEAGFELGIITSNTAENVGIFLENHGLNLFDFIRCKSKLMGKAREIRIVMKSRKVAAQDILFIGDETRDIEASQKAGIRVAAVTWGYNSRKSIEAQHPDLIFDQAEDLVSYLKSQK